MADKKKKNLEEAADGKKLAALEARIEGLNEQLQEAGKKAEAGEAIPVTGAKEFRRLAGKYNEMLEKRHESKEADL